ncbi:hypothetical protein BDR05DRAFT_945405 [Suillus weaverae]|nr:hypothetical protein BDR05DRAFT_945405 [Suillus weaverae]
MACPSDVALIFALLVEEDCFQVANTIMLTCAILQHNWFAISMQASQVEASSKTTFFPYSQDHYCGQGKWGIRVAGAFGEFFSHSMEKNILIKKHQLYESEDINSPLSANKMLQNLLEQNIEIMDLHLLPMVKPSTFQILQLGSITRDIIHNFTTTIQTVLLCNCKTLYEEFSKLELMDNLSCWQSIFQQPANQPLLQPLIQMVYDQLMAANKVLDEEQNILFLLNTAFHLFYNIAPRPFQLKSFRYDLDPDTGREWNLFIVWGVLALANPAAKQLGAAVQECLWAFPSSLVTPILFYLGILRPAFSKLLGLLCGNAKDYNIYIFVHAIPKHKRAGNLWNGADINASLQKHTKSLSITLTGSKVSGSLCLPTEVAECPTWPTKIPSVGTSPPPSGYSPEHGRYTAALSSKSGHWDTTKTY